MVSVAKLRNPTPDPNQHSFTSIESMSLYTPVGRPVACFTISERFTSWSQCRNGAKVMVVSCSIWPPTAMPTAYGRGSPVVIASLEQSLMSLVRVCVTMSGALSVLGASWHPVTILFPASTTTACAMVPLSLMPTKVLERQFSFSPVCGLPRRSVFDAAVKSLGNVADMVSPGSVSTMTPLWMRSLVMRETAPCDSPRMCASVMRDMGPYLVIQAATSCVYSDPSNH